jgi:hypothetical protein
MLANFYFSDLFTEVDPGFLPQTLATGTTSGSAIQLGGSLGYEKLLFNMIFAAGSVANSVSMYLATATVASGTFTSLSQTLVSMVTTLSLSAQYDLKIDTRDVAFANLSSTSAVPSWVKVVVSLAGSTVPMAMKVLGWEAKQDVVSVFQPQTKPVTAYTPFY